MMRCTSVMFRSSLAAFLVSLLAPSLVAEFEMTSFSWLSVELLRGRVIAGQKQQCYKVATFVHPRFNLMLEDSDGETRAVAWTVDVKTGSSIWPIVASEPLLGYYSRNATLFAQLIGHNPGYKDPMKNSEVLGESAGVALPLMQPESIIQLQSECFNVSLAITELFLRDFIPTTTADPAKLAQNAYFGYDASKTSDNEGGVTQTAALPIWSVALVSLLLLVFVVAFVVLLFVHLQSRRRVSKLTIQHQTSGAPSKMHKGHPVINSASSSKSSSPGGSVGVVRTNSIESHYDVPWDQKFRPLPDWLRTDLATALTDGAPRTVPVKPVPCPPQMGTGDSGVESLT